MQVVARLRRIAPYAIIVVASAYLYHRALGFEFERVSGRIGPDAWPRIILTLLIAICAYQVLSLAVRRTTREVEGVLQSLEEVADPSLLEPPQAHPGRALLGIALTFGYLLAFEVAGFFIATFVYLVALMYVGGYRRPVRALAISLAASLSFIFVFMRIVYVSLPLGRGPFLAVSVGVMKLLGIH
ncbi:MAG TPA: tripartite tricarboxylate transporter TctB family protein [Casimicrobiaceae bacterium]|nr:tripartite tricarboxylate transporter TctB family protein [Casimicrobiaceae bacterium]